jgi:tetratricopeptide (TPR) repeat protein
MYRGCAMALVLIFFPIASQTQELDRLLRSGDECYARQATEEALRFYDQAYTLAPRQNETLLRLVRTNSDLGWLHLRTDTSAERYYLHAAAYAESLLSLNPNMPWAHFWMALTEGSLIPFRTVSEKIHIGKEVRFHAEKAIELDSTFALAYIILAVFERESSQLSWFERTIARIIFGEDLSGSLSSSEDLLEKSVKYDPDNSYAYYEMYWTYVAMGKKDAAVESLKKVLALPVKSQREGEQRQLAQNYLTRIESTTR